MTRILLLLVISLLVACEPKQIHSTLEGDYTLHSNIFVTAQSFPIKLNKVDGNTYDIQMFNERIGRLNVTQDSIDLQSIGRAINFVDGKYEYTKLGKDIELLLMPGNVWYYFERNRSL